MNSDNKPKFALGQIVATTGSIAALAESNEFALPFLLKHQTGDWGDVCKEDKELNDQAIAHEGDLDQQQRVLSAYITSKNEKLCVLSASLYEIIFHGWYHIRRQQLYLIRTTYAEPIKIEFAGQACPRAGAF